MAPYTMKSTEVSTVPRYIEEPIGRLDKALDEAQSRGWTVVDIKKDWKKVFPFE